MHIYKHTNTHTHIYIYIYIYIYIQEYIYILRDFTNFSSLLAQLDGAVEYTDCISAEGYPHAPLMSVLHMTLNNLMASLQ